MSGADPDRDQLSICTQDCRARCCRYITVEVPAPRGRADWDEMRWWLAHEGTHVSHDEDGWLLHVATRCTNLRQDNACAVYPHHMDTCKEYDAATCEFTWPADPEHELQSELHSELDLARYLERRKLRRGASVARDIRRAARARRAQGASGLVPLQPLAPR